MFKNLRPDIIVALIAVIIGLSTMIVYIYQARIMSKQMHATVWPYIENEFTEGSEGFKITTQNKGVGPAIVKKYRLYFDGKSISTSRHSIDSLLRVLSGNDSLKWAFDYTNLESRVLSGGEEIVFVHFKTPETLVALKKVLKGHSINVGVCYCSVFDECWVTSAGKTEACKRCD
ncbi:MAG: hypothetical protein J0L66_01175 [Cytophagales bacterium]|nr:hypothetical protein [Cytophagales bacterium]